MASSAQAAFPGRASASAGLCCLDPPPLVAVPSHDEGRCTATTPTARQRDLLVHEMAYSWPSPDLRAGLVSCRQVALFQIALSWRVPL
jgi:hypothetical protein